ncbi:hypothetical protein QWY85_11300 [Neolewinella lacunae]|uniref:Uncharacterized protein n=1 Tax=Neolewinella lacunae TaxID=1517758 RepID=A0A923PGQ4_9BACT|nr:hypothetical protein [Neolewinella lacunae]MBC6993752.1 hypothetical protein [Neolewinella lacunae]MDN3635247.1 hypothetical protein [Neolewinella lacunae]
MKFKSLFFSLCLLFIGTSVFANLPDNTLTGDEPLTIKAANKLIYEAMAKLPADAPVKLVAATSILEDDASCTVTVQISIPGGTGGSVSATAATCREALNMVLAII